MWRLLAAGAAAASAAASGWIGCRRLTGVTPRRCRRWTPTRWSATQQGTARTTPLASTPTAARLPPLPPPLSPPLLPPLPSRPPAARPPPSRVSSTVYPSLPMESLPPPTLSCGCWTPSGASCRRRRQRWRRCCPRWNRPQGMWRMRWCGRWHPYLRSREEADTSPRTSSNSSNSGGRYPLPWRGHAAAAGGRYTTGTELAVTRVRRSRRRRPHAT
mmetsp:Transcript_13852/g.33409  ORF Transcript_13852/g.33409 Transcript_13852/m.33409 type:complete len:216 (-) Transcript_13852:1874-2521(-)